MYDIFEEGKQFFNTVKEHEFISRVFPGCKNISIDYGIMEKAENVYVYPADFGWSDLGTWGSLYEQLKLDSNSNAVQAKNVMLYDSSNNIIKLRDNRLAVIQGLDGYIIVENEDALLICRKEDEQKIKNFVTDLKDRVKE